MSKERGWVVSGGRSVGRIAGSIKNTLHFIFPFMAPEKKEIDYEEKFLFTRLEKRAGGNEKEERIAPPRNILEGIHFDNEVDRINSGLFLKDFESVSLKNKKYSIERFKEIVRPSTALILQRLLKEEKDPSIKFEIIKALSALASQKVKVSAESLKPYLEDDDFRVRVAVVSALYTIKEEGLWELLIHKLKDSHPEVRLTAMNCLNWEYGSQAAPEIASLLYDPDVWIRRTTVQMMGILHFKEAIPALITLLSDGEIELRIAANNALKKITGQDSGFRAKASREKQEEVIEEWRSWWHDNPLRFKVPSSKKGGGK